MLIYSAEERNVTRLGDARKSHKSSFKKEISKEEYDQEREKSE